MSYHILCDHDESIKLNRLLIAKRTLLIIQAWNPTTKKSMVRWTKENYEMPRSI